MSDWISMLNGAMVSIFGCILSVYFCTVLDSNRKRWLFWGGLVLLMALQGVCYSLWDAEVLRQLYPLVVHLPLFLLLCLITRKFIWPLVAVMTVGVCAPFSCFILPFS